MVFAAIPSAVPATMVVLELRGEEIARAKHSGGKKFTQRPVITLQLQLKTFSSKRLKSGKYEFPFSIDLPPSLPSSVQLFKSSSSWCEVKYALRAIIVGVQAGKNTVSQRIIHVQSAPLPSLLYPAMIEPVTKQIKNTMGMSKGSITFGARVTNTHIGRDEDLELRLACRNDATVDVDRVQAKVKEIVEWRGESVVENILVCPNIVPGAEGLGKKSKTELKEKKRAGVEDNYLDIFGEITSSATASDGNSIRLKMPTNSRDTFKGQVVNVKHLLVIKIKTKWGVDDPKIEIPLKVGSRAVDEAHEPTVRLPPPVPLPPPSGDGDNEALPNPVPVAVPIGWSGAEQSLRIIAPPESVVMGGAVVNSSDSGGLGSLEPLAAVPLPVPPPRPTLENLLAEMVSSVNDYDIISAKLEDTEWKEVFSSLSPENFGSIIVHVNQDFEEPRVAALVAPAIGTAFSCNHCAAAVKSCAAWNRIAVVQTLLPFCSDLSSGGRDTIELELTPWEQIVTKADFERSLS